MHSDHQQSDFLPHSVPLANVHFRANAALVDAGKQLAAHHGMAFAELIRHALRRELEIERIARAQGAEQASPLKLSERDTPIKRASQGDIHGQREMMTLELVNSQTYTDATDSTDALKQAEFWARLAMLNGDARDHGMLISVLGLRAKDAAARGDVGVQRRMEAEGIALLSVMADEGNEAAATALTAVAEGADAGLMDGARALVASWTGAA